jgi:uncharacterized membrane protein YuzA (DUF378 family)
MTDQEHLERAYRRLLAWYPRKFRHENEQEILAVLIAGAPHGQRRPGLAEAADLIRSGLWMRLRPSAPRSVRAAVKLMYAGAAVSTVNLVILLALTGDITVSQLLNTPFITVSIAWSLAPLALWLWMARETGRGRNWARIVSTVLFGAATLDLTEVFGPPGIRLSLVPVIAGSPTVPVLYWLVGLAAVWLLWRPASRAFFGPPGYTQAQHQAQMAEFDHQAQMAELARIRARVPRQA